MGSSIPVKTSDVQYCAAYVLAYDAQGNVVRYLSRWNQTLLVGYAVDKSLVGVLRVVVT